MTKSVKPNYFEVIVTVLGKAFNYLSKFDDLLICLMGVLLPGAIYTEGPMVHCLQVYR